jgi:peptidoglycan/LPS O-acetylase OafA/YrhL
LTLHLIHPKYRRDIDGLRAIAVLSVLGFHAFPSMVGGGFVGVDIFFVISGFLISTIIWENLQSNTFTYSEFYSRRIRRLFPALVIVLAATLAFGWFVLLADEFRHLGKTLAASAGFVANFALWEDSGYFSRSADTQPLLHLWSLAIEEQFYLVWPILLSWAWAKKGTALPLALIIAAASFALNVGLVKTNPIATFYSPLSRCWELMLGAVLCFVLREKPQLIATNSHWRAATGLTLVIGSVFLLEASRPFPGWWALLPTLGAFLTLSAPDTWLSRRLLGNEALVRVGLISYPLYLWHWPLLSFARIINGEECPVAVRLLLLFVSVLLAWATSGMLEKRLRYSRSVLAVPALGLALLVFLVGGLLSFREITAPRNGDPDLQRIGKALGDWEYPDGLQAVNVNGHELLWKQAGTEGVLFVGDSHVEQYSPRVVALADRPQSAKSTYFSTTPGCPPVPNVFEDKHPDCAKRRNKALEFAMSPAVEAVVIGGCWNCYFIKERRTALSATEGYDYYYLRDGEKVYFREDGGVGLALAALETMLRQLVRTKKVYLMIDSPMSTAFSPQSHIGGSRLGKMWFKTGPTASVFDSEQQLLRETLTELAARAGAMLIDPIPTLCPDGVCRVLTNDGRPLYKDQSHLRPFFVREFATYIDPAVTDTPVAVAP